MYSNLNRLRALIKLAEEVGDDDSDWFRSVVRTLSVKWNETLYQKTYEALLNRNLKPLLDPTFPWPTKPEDLEAVDGPYKIGTIADTDIEFGLHPIQLQMHGVIGGSTGFGKTTFVSALCQYIIPESRTLVWIIDPKPAGDYRGLAKHFDNVVVLGRDQLKCNPCSNPDNIGLDVLIESVSEVLADCWGVYDAGEGVIMEIFGQVFERCEHPTFIDFIRFLEKEIRNHRSEAPRLKTGLLKDFSVLRDFIPQTP